MQNLLEKAKTAAYIYGLAGLYRARPYGETGSEIWDRPINRGRRMKKSYERPAIVHTEKLEARAVMCQKADDSCGSPGPIQS
jgi:hypothetical protein